MTTKNKQMYEDFNLVFNNLASNLAPGLTLFEISMYLTKAYQSLVATLYSSYEKDELSRQALAPLTRSEKLLPSNISDFDKIVPESVLFELSSEILYLVHESIDMASNASKCFKNKRIKVTPITHDDFHNIYNNPFKFNNSTALRLGVSDDAGKNISEIICKDSHIKNYFIRYIRKPSPIILDNNIGEIEGITTESECELNTMYFSDIVKLAAQLAYQDYKSI